MTLDSSACASCFAMTDASFSAADITRRSTGAITGARAGAVAVSIADAGPHAAAAPLAPSG